MSVTHLAADAVCTTRAPCAAPRHHARLHQRLQRPLRRPPTVAAGASGAASAALQDLDAAGQQSWQEAQRLLQTELGLDEAAADEVLLEGEAGLELKAAPCWLG